MSENYTLIIGAGVNKEVNQEIDTGPQLIRSIADRVTDRTSPEAPVLSSSLMTHFDQLTGEVRANYLSHLEKYCNSVKNPSIDAFAYEVETYPEFKSLRQNFRLITRAMIIAHVLGWEGTSSQDIIKEELHKKSTWLSVLGDFIEQNHILEKGKNAPLTLNIATFNYDRILEYYLIQRFGSKADFFIVNNISHIYGLVGALTETTKIYPDDDVVEMGYTNNDFTSIANWTNNIRLINQRAQEIKVPEWLARTKKVIVFGYGLDPINNRRIHLEDFKGKDINFHFNIYTGNDALFDFTPRRNFAEKVREIKIDANLQYMSCREFLAYSLETPVV